VVSIFTEIRQVFAMASVIMERLFEAKCRRLVGVFTSSQYANQVVVSNE